MEKFKISSIIFFAVTALAFCETSAYAVPPKVTKSVPENGDQNVDPGLKQIRIEFDQDMSQGGYSICGGGPKYPKTIGKPKWIDKRTIVMRVRLAANYEYELSVNCQSYRNFKNLHGQSAVIHSIKFKTGTADRESIKSSKRPALLLQEGIYAEETEGDIEKAIGLYEQVLEQYREIERLAARATYQLGMCHLKKGEKDKAAEYFEEAIDYYPDQKSVVKKAQAQLEKIKPEVKESVFEQIDYQVIKFISEKFGETAFKASEQYLMVNSHIYYVDRDGFLYKGGMNAFYNWTGRTISQKVRFGGTSYPNQTHYGVDGNELNTEIVPDKTRSNHWQIYWIPDEPLAPEESLYFGWSLNDKRKLSKMPGDVYSLRMQNQYGSAAFETFFLVLPKELKISQSNPPTDSQELLNFNVFWWTKQVQQNENHVEQVQLEKGKIEYTFGSVSEQDKLVAEDLTAQGWKLWGQRKLTEAEEKFEEAIDKNPEAEGAYQGLGWAQLNQGKKLNAKDSFEKCLKLNPKNSTALNGLGWVAHGQGGIDEAIQWWEKAIEANPGATASLNGLTQVYMEKKEYDKAIQYYEMWLKAEPDNDQAKEGLEKAKTSNKN